MLRRGLHLVVVLAALVAIAAIAQFAYLMWRINWTGARDRAQPADAIVVLGARVESGGQAGPDLQSRTSHAVDLYRQGLAPYIICTGGYHGDRMSAAAVARRLAIKLGVPAERVLTADGSMTTSEDAVSTAQLMSSRGLRSAILVSHPLHLERARLLFESQGIAVYPSPTSTDLKAIPARTRSFLTAREALGILWSVFDEVGLPSEWTAPLSRWFYGESPALGAM